MLDRPLPVGRRVATDVNGMTLDMPLYQWKFDNVKALSDLGLTVTSEEILAGTAAVDIDGDTQYLRESPDHFAVNWFAPNEATGYRRPDPAPVLAGTGLLLEDLTWSGGDWMPVLEPVVDLVPNDQSLGHERAEVIFAQ